ncbi:MAG TPA: hypothetical protein VE999_02680 [Gemmataceae bacterium]|nr:hypothetical protein [Gemmataceae bacterium]
MNSQQIRTFAHLLAWGVFLGLCTGCTGRGTAKYIPSEDKARQALEAALNAWRDGKKPGSVEGAPMPVQVVDSQWQSGKKLQSYEIVGEEPNEGPRVFSVRLTLQQPSGQQATTRYYIVGKDPLWVYREADYKAPAGM